jgi:tight adherence protein C
VILALISGSGVGAGLWLIARGWAPPRLSLAESLAQLRTSGARVSSVVVDGDARFAARVGRPIAHLLAQSGIRWVIWPGVGGDLAVLGRSRETHLAEKVTLALVGLLLVPATTAVLALGGAHLPLVVPLWGSLLFAAVGFWIPDVGIHAEAQARRRDFRHALGAFLDLVVVALAGGGGVETALEDAVGIGNGWAFDHLRHALDRARLARETPWAALAQVGDELGVPELAELAATVALAGTEGAKVRASLSAKAVSLRVHELTDAEASAQSATERMSLPVVLLFAGFLTFVGYPAVEHVLTGL